MKNIDYVNYIENQIFIIFGDKISVFEKKYKNEINNNFIVKYVICDVFISFIKDRGYLEVEIYENGNYKMLHDFNRKFLDIELSVSSIDMVIKELKEIVNVI